MKEMEFLGVRIPRNVKEWLERVAEESEVPVSRVVRMILEAEMERARALEEVGGKAAGQSSSPSTYS